MLFHKQKYADCSYVRDLMITVLEDDLHNNTSGIFAATTLFKLSAFKCDCSSLLRICPFSNEVDQTSAYKYVWEWRSLQ